MVSGKEKERELIIKLHNEKKTCHDIASILGISKSKVSYWICRQRKTDKFSDLPRSGRPTKLSPKKLEMIYSALRREEMNNNCSGFSTKKVAELLQKKTGKKYTMRHVRRILKRMNIALIAPRASHIRKDEKKIGKFKQEFKTTKFHSSKMGGQSGILTSGILSVKNHLLWLQQRRHATSQWLVVFDTYFSR